MRSKRVQDVMTREVTTTRPDACIAGWIGFSRDFGDRGAHGP